MTTIPLFELIVIINHYLLMISPYSEICLIIFTQKKRKLCWQQAELQSTKNYLTWIHCKSGNKVELKNVGHVTIGLAQMLCVTYAATTFNHIKDWKHHCCQISLKVLLVENFLEKWSVKALMLCYIGCH